VHDVTGLTKLRQRMISVLIALAVGVVYSLVTTAYEMSVNTVMIDTHLSYLAALVAAVFVVFGRSFLANPL
jgi:hypothetical protein